MVNATVDNKPVSIQLSPGQSTTVPSNKTWKVQIAISLANKSNASRGSVKINTVSALGADNSGNAEGPVAPSTVLVGGDTVSLKGAKGASISGFVVDS